MPQESQRPSLASLAWLIARDANLTLGGGSATAEMLRRSLTARHWLSDEQHRRMFALSRLTPGTNLLAYCVAVGWQVRGVGGALIAWLASSIPSSLVAVVVTVFVEQASQSRVVALVVLLGTATAIVLLLLSAWHLAAPQLRGSPALRTCSLVGLVALLGMGGVSPIGILMVAGTVGAAWRIEPQ